MLKLRLSSESASVADKIIVADSSSSKDISDNAESIGASLIGSIINTICIASENDCPSDICIKAWSKEEKSEEVQYAHRGLANRSFERQWTITDDVEIKEVIFQDGLLTINLGKVVPEHHARQCAYAGAELGRP